MTGPQVDGLLEELKKHSPSKELGERYARDKEWLGAHRDELLKEHPEHWVAVYREIVVAAHPNLRDMINIVRENGLEGRHVAAEFITSRSVNMIL